MADTRTTPLTFNTHAAADYCGLGVSTLEKLRVSGGGPDFFKLGRRVVYRRDDVNAWLAAKRRQSTSVSV